MQKLIHGLHPFRNTFFRSHQEFFERLARGQRPEALFVTCSDSRIEPNLLTQTGPGDLFILRNAGKLETGEVFAFDPAEGQFLPLVPSSSGPPRAAAGSRVLRSI